MILISPGLEAVGHKLGAWHDVGWYEMPLHPRPATPAPPIPWPNLPETR